MRSRVPLAPHQPRPLRIGLTGTLLMDEKSMIGSAAQTLFVTPAPATPT
ncbi:hypothetical protein ACW4TU_39570 [Streptomyces sp. QTS52]